MAPLVAMPMAPRPVDDGEAATVGLAGTVRLYEPLKSSMFPGAMESYVVTVGSTNSGWFDVAAAVVLVLPLGSVVLLSVVLDQYGEV